MPKLLARPRSASRGSYFDLAVVHACLETWLRKRRGPIQNPSVFERHTRAVPGTYDTQTIERPLRQGAPQMRTGLRDGINPLPAAEQQHRHAVSGDPA